MSITTPPTERSNVRTIAVAALGLLIAVPVAAGILTAPTTPAIASADQLVDSGWGELLASANSQRAKSDAIPAEYSIDPSVAGSSLRIAGDKKTRYWIGLDAQGRLCLVLAFTGPDEIAVTGCTDRDAFVAEGLGVQANTVDGAVVAYLLPDAQVPFAPGVGLARSVPNLLTGDPFAIAEQGAQLIDPAGLSSFESRQFDTPAGF
jgi:hypothetical protein